MKLNLIIHKITFFLIFNVLCNFSFSQSVNYISIGANETKNYVEDLSNLKVGVVGNHTSLILSRQLQTMQFKLRKDIQHGRNLLLFLQELLRQLQSMLVGQLTHQYTHLYLQRLTQFAKQECGLASLLHKLQHTILSQVIWKLQLVITT